LAAVDPADRGVFAPFCGVVGSVTFATVN